MWLAEKGSGDWGVIAVVLTTVWHVTDGVDIVSLAFNRSGDLIATVFAVRSVNAATRFLEYALSVHGRRRLLQVMTVKVVFFKHMPLLTFIRKCCQCCTVVCARFVYHMLQA